VQAVVNLVSSSVEGLSPERVSMADSKGRQLTSSVEGGISAAVGDLRTTQTARFEDDLENSVQQMLSAVVGSGKAVVRVSAELDFDKKNTVTEKFNPDDKQAPAVTKATESEKYAGADQIVGGILGPENVDTDLEDGENSYEKTKEVATLAVDKVTETATAAPGSVERLSVAVILDAGAAGTVSPDAIKQLVTAATGASAERGDVVEVDRMAFDDSAAKAAEEEFAQIAAAEAGAKRMSMIRTGAILFVLLLLVLYALRIMRRDRRTPVELPYEVDVTQAALEAERIAALAAAERLALEPAMSGAEVKRLEIKGEIGELVERQPEEVAQLLRGWLADRRN
jgi:flagellar M-ring protein FliF